MRIYGLFVTREGNTEFPEMVDAWDEYTRDENEDGYQDAVGKWQSETDVDAFAVVEFELPEQAVMNALYPDPVVVEAKVVRL